MATKRYWKVIDGRKRRMPGATTVLKNIGWGSDGLAYWSWEQGYNGLTRDEAMRPARTVGTVTHACIEAELTGQPAPDWQAFDDQQLVDQIGKALQAWQRWRELNDFELLAAEWSGTHPAPGMDYGGTLDIAMVQGAMCIGDWKTSKAIYGQTLCQLVAYGKLWEANHPEDHIEEYRAVRFGKHDASLHDHLWPAVSLEPEWEAFQCALRLHAIAKQQKGKV